MEGPLSPRAQRLIIRALFAGAVLLPTLYVEEISVLQRDGLKWLLGAYVAFALLLFLLEKEERVGGWGTFAQHAVSGFFPAVLVALTGGGRSEFFVFFYLQIAMAAPVSSWLQVVLLPGLTTVFYLAAVWFGGGGLSAGQLALRVAFFWLLAPFLKAVAEKAAGERERTVRLAAELSRTHDEIRRYTAALEKANAANEKRLAEITLLHAFGLEMRTARNLEKAYTVSLAFAYAASSLPAIFLGHRRGEGARVSLRFRGTPKPETEEWVRAAIAEAPCARETVRDGVEVPGLGLCQVRFLARGRGNGACAVMAVLVPERGEKPESEQWEVLAAIMDSLDVEIDLFHLRFELEEAARVLEEKNSHLLKLHQLHSDLTRAAYSGQDPGEVLQGIQEVMARELFDLDRLNLFLPNRETGMLECRTSVGVGDYPLDRIRVPLDWRGGAVSLAFREGRTIFFDGAGPLPPEYRLAEPYSLIPAIRSRIFVIVPLIDPGGKVLGVIGADRKHSHRPIPSETVLLLEFFARQAALVLSLQDPCPSSP